MWQMFTNGCYYWFSTSLGLFWLCQTSNHPEASPLTACLHHTHDSFAFSHCDISHTYSYKECHKTGFRAWKCFTETDEPLNISQSATSSEWKGLPWRAPHLWDLYSRLRNGKKKKNQLSNFSSILNNHDTTHLEIPQKPPRFGNTVEPSLAQATNNSK